MKKLLACILTGALALCLGACGSNNKDQTAEAEAVIAANEALEAYEGADGVQTEISEIDPVNEGAVLAGGSAGSAAAEQTDDSGETDAVEVNNVDSDNVEISAEGDISTDKISFGDISEEEAEEETAKTEASEAADVPDISQAVDGSATSETEPAPFGTWVKTALYATQDKTYHTVYVRIVKVTTESNDAAYVESAIAANNGYGDENDLIDPEEMDIQDDAEIVVMDYEVYVPENFPTPSYGITEPKIYFSMRNIGGGGIPSLDGSTAYIGMGTTDDMVVRPSSESYTPGNTYGERCIYTMVKGYTGYVASYSSYPDGTSSDETSSENMYTVYHSVNR